MAAADVIPVTLGAEGRPQIRPWHAVRVRPRREMSVEKWFEKSGFDCFVPVVRTRRRWSDRIKSLVAPVIPGYVFVRFLVDADILPVLRVPGVVQILGSNLQPVPIPDEEIIRFRRAIEAASDAKPCNYVAGGKVTVKKGPLAGQIGTVVRMKGETRLIVSLDLLRRSVSVEIDAASL